MRLSSFFLVLETPMDGFPWFDKSSCGLSDLKRYPREILIHHIIFYFVGMVSLLRPGYLNENIPLAVIEVWRVTLTAHPKNTRVVDPICVRKIVFNKFDLPSHGAFPDSRCPGAVPARFRITLGAKPPCLDYSLSALRTPWFSHNIILRKFYGNIFQ